MKNGNGNGNGTLRKKLIKATARGRSLVRRRVRPGLRWPVGLLLIGFGILGFLPILGFWMIPLGIAVMAMDIGPVLRRRRLGEPRRGSRDDDS